MEPLRLLFARRQDWTRDQGKRMSSDRRIYSDQEFALILSRAADLASATHVSRTRGDGLTLEDMKAIAAEAGLDPVLVERAARHLPVIQRDSAIARAVGGPIRCELDIVVDGSMSKDRAEQLRTTIEATLQRRGGGDTTSSGLSWQSAIGLSLLFVSASAEGDNTRVRITVDRRISSIVTSVLSLSGIIVGLVIIENAGPPSPVVAWGILGLSVGATLALARASWASATRRIREKTAALLDAIGSAVRKADVSGSVES